MEPTDRASLNESLAGGKLAGIENLISVTPCFLNNWSHTTKLTGKEKPAYWDMSYIRIVLGKMPRWTILLSFLKMLKS